MDKKDVWLKNSFAFITDLIATKEDQKLETNLAVYCLDQELFDQYQEDFNLQLLTKQENHNHSLFANWDSTDNNNYKQINKHFDSKTILLIYQELKQDTDKIVLFEQIVDFIQRKFYESSFWAIAVEGKKVIFWDQDEMIDLTETYKRKYLGLIYLANGMLTAANNHFLSDSDLRKWANSYGFQQELNLLNQKFPQDISWLIQEKRYGGNNKRDTLVLFVFEKQNQLVQPFYDKNWYFLDESDENYWYTKVKF